MKVSVRQSTIEGERGLFANINIKKGEHLCILPIDYLKIGENWYSLQSDNQGLIDFRYGIKCDMIIPNSDKNVSVLGTFMNFLKSPRIATRQSLRISLSGVSNSQKIEDDFVGHMMNDFVDMSLLDKPHYEKISHSKENIDIESDLELFNSSQGIRLGLRVTAKKPILKNEELFFSYGTEYWKNYSGRGNFELIPDNIEIIKL